MPLIIDHSVRIQAPAATVWQVITDLASYPEWNPFCLEASSTLKPGDPIDMRVKLMGSVKTQREWMTDHEPGVYLAYRMKPVPLGALASKRSHRVIPLSDELTEYQSHFELRGWLMPLTRALLGSTLRQGFAGMTQGIVRRAEAVHAPA